MTDDKLHTSLSANTIMAKLTNQFLRTRLINDHRLTNTIHLTQKISAQVVETSVTNNRSFQNYSHSDDNTLRIAIVFIYLASATAFRYL